MKKYIYQKFLLNCNYEVIKMEHIPKYMGNLELIMPLGFPYCLFDLGKPIIRKIALEKLDDTIDTEYDWEIFVRGLKDIDELIIYNKNHNTGNVAVDNYRRSTLLAYILRLKECNHYLKVYYNDVALN